jgi:hypothetical protein
MTDTGTDGWKRKRLEKVKLKHLLRNMAKTERPLRGSVQESRTAEEKERLRAKVMGVMEEPLTQHVSTRERLRNAEQLIQQLLDDRQQQPVRSQPLQPQPLQPQPPQPQFAQPQPPQLQNPLPQPNASPVPSPGQNAQPQQQVWQPANPPPNRQQRLLHQLPQQTGEQPVDAQALLTRWQADLRNVMG